MIKFIVAFALIAVASSLPTDAQPKTILESYEPVAIVNINPNHEIVAKPILASQSTLGPVGVYGIKDAPLTIVPLDSTHGASAVPVAVIPQHVISNTGLPTLDDPIFLEDPTTTVPVQLGPLQDVLTLIINAIKESIEKRKQQNQ